MGEQVDLTVADQRVMGYLAVPAEDEGPVVLVCHAWWGLNDVFRGYCDRLAAAGFVALAPDLYEGATTTEPDEAMRLLRAGLPDERMKIVRAAAGYLLRDRRNTGRGLGVLGFSMGAGYASELATLDSAVRAVVMYYGGAEQEPGFASGTQAALMGHFADPDDWEPVEMARGLEADLRAAGNDVEFHYYPGQSHWFAESNRPDVFDPEADALAWERTLDFLRRHL